MTKKILVTTAWPYANGPLHLGHLAGSYLPADIFARYNRMVGNETLMVSGTDEHGTPISVQAERENRSPRDVVDKYNEIIKRSLEDIGCSYDLFTRTTTENHRKTVQDFFLTLVDHGFIYEKTMNLPYCSKCNKFLPDRYIEGTCPKCSAKEARGDQCDECGRTLDPIELIDPYCKHCHTMPETRDSRHYFFKLSAFQGKLIAWIETKKGQWRPNVYNFTINWLKEGLLDRPITRDLKWGIPIPLEGAEGKVIYVWFEAVIGYLSATKQYFAERGRPDAWRDWWEDPNTETYYFIGKDNIPFHTIIWPAMLLGYGELNLPSAVPANEFLNFGGGKFSTSKGYAVWLDGYLEHFDPDPLRYYLSINMPESKDADFTWDEFKRRNNEELVSTFGNFVHRVLTFIDKFYDGTIPEAADLDERDLSILDDIDMAVDEVGIHIQKCEFKRAMARVMSLASLGNQYFNEKAPWKKRRSRENALYVGACNVYFDEKAQLEEEGSRGNTLYVSACIVRTLSILITPFLPFSAQKLWNMLGYAGSVHEQEWESAMETVKSQCIKDVKPLFKLIEDADIKEWNAKLGKV